MKSLKEIRDQEVKKYGTKENNFIMFPVGTRVKIITPVCDHNFFYGETGTVTKNTGEYLGITVKYDSTRYYTNGKAEGEWNFNPEDLFVIGFKNQTNCPFCGQSMK